MATTRIMSIHVNRGKTPKQCVSAQLNYIMNPEKTDGGALISFHACMPETAVNEFMLYRQEYLNNTGREIENEVLVYHVGYSLIPSTAAQKMMVINGNGGEGKSQIGVVLSRMFGSNAKDGSIGKVSENRFARADLEHVLLMIDDDMRLEALKQTNYIKSLVTAQGKMDLEKKCKQSYQGYLYARVLAFSNGDLQSLYDRSDGFFRRQLILTTREKSLERTDDPHIADKLCAELEGIFLWAFAGLQRLAANHFCFTESARAVENRKAVRQDANNLIAFMEAKDHGGAGYFRQ